MNAIINEFFKRDLNESEAQALEELLENSPSEASRFGEKLRGEYLALGLPDPMPHVPATPAAPGSLGLLKSALAALALGVAGFTAWSLWPRPAVVAVPQPVPVRSMPQPKTHHLPPPPIVTPERLTGAQEGNRLSVVVELGTAAPVQVLILDPQDHPVRSLFTGNLKPGKWSLHWDGLLDDGSKAPAGPYHIQVQSGPSKMSKTVRIE